MRLSDEETEFDLLKDAVEKLRYELTLAQIRIGNLEHIVHELHMHVNDTDRHLDYVEQSLSE